MGLKEYNQKRNFKKTKEPLGIKEKTNKSLKYVMQFHMASRAHFDLRLEWKGTLISWAIPKGPSYNPEDKRLAIHVEDHPLSYRYFEGNIPKEEYGGGTVMIWDEGTWEPITDPNLKEGNLKFKLKGKRLTGIWNLVHMQEQEWLLIKEKENLKKIPSLAEFTTSIRTNRTMKEIKDEN